MLIPLDILAALVLVTALTFAMIYIVAYIRIRSKRLLFAALIFAILTVYSAVLIISVLLDFGIGPIIYHVSIAEIVLLILLLVTFKRWREENREHRA